MNNSEKTLTISPKEPDLELYLDFSCQSKRPIAKTAQGQNGPGSKGPLSCFKCQNV